MLFFQIFSFISRENSTFSVMQSGTRDGSSFHLTTHRNNSCISVRDLFKNNPMVQWDGKAIVKQGTEFYMRHSLNALSNYLSTANLWLISKNHILFKSKKIAVIQDFRDPRWLHGHFSLTNSLTNRWLPWLNLLKLGCPWNSYQSYTYLPSHYKKKALR